MLNTSSCFSEIMVACICEHDLRKEIKTIVYLSLVYGIGFKIMERLTKSKEDKIMIKDSLKSTSRLNGI